MKHNTHFNYAAGSGISGKHRNRLLRDSEFNKHYRRVLDLMFEFDVPDARRQAVNFVVRHMRPHYHVSLDRAIIVVRNLLKGRSPLQKSLQADMWAEITEQVRALMAVCPRMSLTYAVQWVIDNCRATRYYLSPRYAYRKIHFTNFSKSL